MADARTTTFRDTVSKIAYQSMLVATPWEYNRTDLPHAQLWRLDVIPGHTLLIITAVITGLLQYEATMQCVLHV